MKVDEREIHKHVCLIKSSVGHIYFGVRYAFFKLDACLFDKVLHGRGGIYDFLLK